MNQARRGSTPNGPAAALSNGPVIETRGLTRDFRNKRAVEEVDLRVHPGKIYGLLGPNGAGKSTTLKMILGLLRPSAGTISLFGAPWRRESLGRIGASVDGPSLYGHLSARAHLQVHAHLIGVGQEEIQSVLDKVGLGDTGRARVRTFSTGMKGRLALATAMLGDPELLLLDEPQNGLDPEGMAALRSLMRDVVSTGRTIVLSSHLLNEVGKVATDIGVIKSGRLIFQGSVRQFAPDGDIERSYFQ
ncbi:ATP-binding cassette domain-containing protein [Pseudonocardia sp. ICBG1142]|uniref:ATP-binding cassette domain-containing protein n=1 Tax=Pseudonocardia sp. ICBG1142 TaxID=2846760 RepID=UPI001CF679EC|nr:ATP-binding cassette domain-containing protein [Pseudonocardia sp. ICBG1142]